MTCSRRSPTSRAWWPARPSSQPHRVARYLEDLSGTYHRFYDACRVLPHAGEPFDDLGRARLWLAEAAKIVLANALGLLGVTAPDRL